MKILFTLPCLLFGIFVHPILLYAGTNITVPFSSTFDCPESAQSSWGSMDDIAGCPGWQGFGSWTTSAGSGDRISSQDNNPSGGGGRGFGAAVGDGHNNSGGRIIASFAEQPELWVRFYMKYPAGFSWVNGEPEWQKILRFRGPTNSDVVFQFRDWTDAELSFYLPGTISTNVGGSCGWTCIMGGSTGDSVWHLYEIHVKRGNPGILEAWVDGNRIFINTTTHVADSGFTNLEIIDNQNAPNNGGDRYISVDDIAISTTGYIGPIGGGSDTNPPTVSLTAPANDATVSGTTTVSATASDNSGTVSGVQFRLDGANLGAEDTTSPFSTSWNTTTATNGSHTLTAIARDSSGNTATSSSVSVTVNNGGTPAPTVTLTANPTSIASGSSSTLTWTSTNATACTASGSWSGSRATSGNQSVSPTSTSTYTLTCTGAGGSDNASATVSVSSSGNKFSIGDRVEVTQGPVNVRSAPSTSGTVLGSQTNGVQGTVTAGPTTADGYTWYQINFDTGADGWSAEYALTEITSEAVACNTVTTANFSQSAYNSYGAPYDLFAANAQLVDARCSASDTHTITATIGKTGDTTRIVYTKGYYFDPGVNNWAQYTSTCTGTLNGDWCAGPTTATITDADLSTASSGTPAYFVGMVCSVQGGGWKCGCRDTTCGNFYWMIQGAGQ